MKKYVMTMIGVIIILLLLCQSAIGESYRDVIAYHDEFITVGSSGQINTVSLSGDIVPIDTKAFADFECIAYQGNTVYIGGSDGTLIVTDDMVNFTLLNTGTEKNIVGICNAGDSMLAITEDGTILTIQQDRVIDIQTHDIDSLCVGIASSRHATVAVFASGLFLILQEDGSFSEYDYNLMNQDHVEIKAIGASGGMIYAVGVQDTGETIAITTLLGGVWMKRNLFIVQDTSTYVLLTETPLGIAYCEEQDHVLLTCADGALIVLPSCVKCNAVYHIANEDLWSAAYNGDTLCIIGSNDTIITLHADMIEKKDNPDLDCEGGC
jgi:hypothetical protein